MIYLISGLGADERVFQKLDFGNRATTFLPWLLPQKKDEPMQEYLVRFSQNINQKDEIILVGVSFGGMMAVELAKTFRVKKIILISSLKTHHEFSLLLRFLKRIKLYEIIPSYRLRNRFRFLSHYFIGSKTKEEKKALDDLLNNTDERIIDWSVRSVFKWKNEQAPDNLYHIHGTQDRIFPFRYLQQTFPVQGGTHFMIANRADEVSKIMQMILSKA